MKVLYNLFKVQTSNNLSALFIHIFFLLEILEIYFQLGKVKDILLQEKSSEMSSHLVWLL